MWNTVPITAPKIMCSTSAISGTMMPMATPKKPAPGIGMIITIMPSQAAMPNRMTLTKEVLPGIKR